MLNKTMNLQSLNVPIKGVFTLGLLFFSSLVSQPLWAWGANGHRIVGAIAEQQLSPYAAKRIDVILNGQSLAQVSTWADEMRSNPEPFWQKRSVRWHFINIDSIDTFNQQTFHAKAHKDEIDDAYTAVLSAIEALKNPNTSADDQTFYLQFLVHIIGDVHQPMHVGYSQDRGGNRINVEFFSQVTNLHRLWDTQLLENQALSYSEYVDFITRLKVQDAQLEGTPIKQWLVQSHQIAKGIYTGTNEQVGYNYVYRFKPVMEQQLLRAGLRLGALLNSIYVAPNGAK